MCRVLYSSFSTDVFCYVSLVYCTRYISPCALGRELHFMSYLLSHFLGGRGWLVYYGVHTVSYSISQHPFPPSNFNRQIQKYGLSDNVANFLRRLALVVLT
jgi:hypothetical protein